MSGILIRGGRLLDPASATDQPCDLRIEQDKVASVATPGALAVKPGEVVIEAAGKWVLPGLIDLHVHLREPGEEYKEDIASGSRAAAAGGFTTIVAMPNTRPATDNPELVRRTRQRGFEAGFCRVLPAAAVSVGQRGEALTPFAELRAAGAVALSDDGRPVANARLMRDALIAAREAGLTIHSHAEELSLAEGGAMHEGAVSAQLGLPGVPAAAEDLAVARDLLLADATSSPLHICHVSTGRSVEMIRAAKARGVRVTAEATPHHFTLTDEAVVRFGTRAKMSPPLRPEADRRAVIGGLLDGTIDAIATDHAPHSGREKETAFAQAANGIIGLETALPLALDLWRREGLPLLEVIARLTSGPARVLGLPYGRLAEGCLADVCVVDPELAWRWTESGTLSKSRNSPFYDTVLNGAVEATILAGAVTYRRQMA